MVKRYRHMSFLKKYGAQYLDRPIYNVKKTNFKTGGIVLLIFAVIGLVNGVA